MSNRHRRREDVPDPVRQAQRDRIRRRFPRSKTEPALIRGAVVAVLAALGALGWSWAANVDDDTVTVIGVVVAALIPLGQALWTRYVVTPNAKVVARVSVSEGRVIPGPASIPPDLNPNLRG